MGRESDRRRRRPSHSSSRDARTVVQKDDIRTPAGDSDYPYHQSSGRHARSSRSAVKPMPPAPPKAASAYAAPPSASKSYRTRRGDIVYETEVPRSAYMSGGGGRRRRPSDMSVDESYRQMRVSTGLTSSSDQESEDDSADGILDRTSDIEEEDSESESEEDYESDDSSPTRRRGQRREGQILSNRRQLQEPEQESSDESEHHGAQLARTPSHSSGPSDEHYRTPESQRRRQKLIEGPPSMPRAETMPFQKTPPRRKPERRRAQSEILDAQPSRSMRRLVFLPSVSILADSR